jgi:hypothetical protein
MWRSLLVPACSDHKVPSVNISHPSDPRSIAYIGCNIACVLIELVLIDEF